MKKLVYSINPHAVRRPDPPAQPLAVKASDLARLGIPPRKIPRVLEELGRLANQNPAFARRDMQLKLARGLAKQFL